VHLYINLFFGQLPPLCTGRQTTVIESSTEPESSVGREKYIQNMLRGFRDTIRVVNLLSGLYRLDANLETLVNFSKFLYAYGNKYTNVTNWKE
jgi:hypothetical protein